MSRKMISIKNFLIHTIPKDIEIVSSMWRKANYYDNEYTESFFSTINAEHE
jgi:hypothetical protein